MKTLNQRIASSRARMEKLEYLLNKMTTVFLKRERKYETKVDNTYKEICRAELRLSRLLDEKTRTKR